MTSFDRTNVPNDGRRFSYTSPRYETFENDDSPDDKLLSGEYVKSVVSKSPVAQPTEKSTKSFQSYNGNPFETVPVDQQRGKPVDQSKGKIDEVQKDVSQVTGLMKANLVKVLARDQTLNDLQDAAEDLSRNASKFEEASAKVKRAMCFNNMKYTAIFIFVILLVVLIIALSIYFGSKH